MLKVKRITRLNRFALAHPYIASCLGFVVLTVWLVVLNGQPLPLAATFAAMMAIINMILWIPNRGPLWKYSKTAIDEWDRKMAAEDTEK